MAAPRAMVVVPCFNEASRLDLPGFVPLLDVAQLVFVDDGSTDGTRAMLQRLAAERPGTVSVLGLETNGGKAEAVRRGLLYALEAGADVVGYLDADLATPAEEMTRVLAALEGPVSCVLASRVRLLGRQIERSAVRHLLGRVFATAASWSLGIPVYDTQCGAKAFRVTPALRQALAQPFTMRWGFDVELLARLLEPGGQVAPIEPEGIIELPLMRWRDVRGSKLRSRAMVEAGLAVLGLGVRRRLGPGPSTGR